MNDSKPRLHVIAFDVPDPPNYGGVIDVFYRIESFVNAGIGVVLHTFDYSRKKSAYLSEICEEVHYYPRKMGLPFPLNRPWIVSSRESSALLQTLIDQISTIGLTESTTFLKEYFITFTAPDKAIEFPEVRYAYNKAELLVDTEVSSTDSLDYLYRTLVDNPTIIIELQAHTDSRGKDAYNLELSQRRAESCVQYLESKGIPSDRMVAKGYGETRLRISDSTIAKMQTEEEKEAAHQKNRRTEFSVLNFNYVPKDNN